MIKAKTFELSGLSFNCVFGIYTDGAFCAFINWDICTRLSRSDTGYNAQKIRAAFRRSTEKAWLPQSGQKRTEIATELSKLITEELKNMF